MSIFFFNTMGRCREEFKALNPPHVKMYTCGPTVYNFAHIGNFRAYVFEDILRRTLKYFGYKVTQIMNLTDVDDKTIRDSRAAGIFLHEFTGKYKKAFFDDLYTLNIDPAEVYPAATEHIPEMIALIATLMAKGFAYQADDGSVYFSIAKFPQYGKLSRIDMENQRSGERIKNDEYAKDAVADFALWKAWDQNDGDVGWDSPWGKGRPGWHVECSAMSMKYLGKTFDIHTGGIDNMFPHHEDEIAQSEAANDCTYVKYWLHCDHLIINGEKMSKSAGNFFTLRDLTAKNYSGEALRWVLLSAHYRKKLNFTLDSCTQAGITLKKFRDFFDRLRKTDAETGEDEKIAKAAKAAKTAFAAAMGDDLNISEALAAMFALEKETNRLMDSHALSFRGALQVLDQFRDFDRILGVLKVDNDESDNIPEKIKTLAEKRLQARRDRNFTAADAIREELKQKGWVMEDATDGYRLKPL